MIYNEVWIFPFLSALEFFVCKITKMEEILNYYFRNLKNFTTWNMAKICGGMRKKYIKHCYRNIFSDRVKPENSIFDTPHHYNMQKKIVLGFAHVKIMVWHFDWLCKMEISNFFVSLSLYGKLLNCTFVIAD